MSSRGEDGGGDAVGIQLGTEDGKTRRDSRRREVAGRRGGQSGFGKNDHGCSEGKTYQGELG